MEATLREATSLKVAFTANGASRTKLGSANLAVAALRLFESRKNFGKVVVTI